MQGRLFVGSGELSAPGVNQGATVGNFYAFVPGLRDAGV